MTEDMLLGVNLSAADLYTPLYGYVFHFNTNTLVPPSIRALSPTTNPPLAHHMDHLHYSNILLSRKLVHRFQPALSSQVQITSRYLIQEIEHIWPKDFQESSSTRFTFSEDAVSVVPPFMTAHLRR